MIRKISILSLFGKFTRNVEDYLPFIIYIILSILIHYDTFSYQPPI